MNKLGITMMVACGLLLSTVSDSNGETQKYFLLNPTNPDLVTIAWVDPAQPDGKAEIRVFDRNQPSSCERPVYSTNSGTIRQGQELFACSGASASALPRECQCER